MTEYVNIENGEVVFLTPTQEKRFFENRDPTKWRKA